MPRLPQIGGDAGDWGNILNEYLSQTLADDGTIKDNAVTAAALAPNSVTVTAIADNTITATQIADGSITESQLDTALQAKVNASSAVTSVAGKTGVVTLLKTDVGLGNVDNTSDADKPVSTATTNALAAKANTVHAHPISDVTGLQTALDAKSPLSSPTFVGSVTVPTPTVGTDAANKTYVDTTISNFSPTIADGSITESKLSMSNAPSTDQVITWNGSEMTWANQLSAGMTQKDWEDANYAVMAISPSVESGLTAVVANAWNNDAPLIQAMLTYIKNTYGGGTLYMPPGKTCNCNSAISIPSGVRVVGYKSRWDFWYASSSITAVTITGSSCAPLQGLHISGSQYNSNDPSNRNVTTSTGVKLTGNTVSFIDVRISGFNWGVDLTADNTYIINFDHSVIENCMVGLNVDLSNIWSGRSSTSTNSGERISFTSSVIANCDTQFWASGNGCSVFFTNTSLDFPVLFGKIYNAHVYFANSHLESVGGSDRPRYMFDVISNSRVTMTNCSIVMGGNATDMIYQVFNPAQGPWNYGWGLAMFTGCYAFFELSPNARLSATMTTTFSEGLIRVPAGTTSVVLASFFITKWNMIKVTPAAYDGTATTTIGARVTAFNITDGTVTITLDSAPASAVYYEVNF